MAKKKTEDLSFANPLFVAHIRNCAAIQASQHLSISFRDAKELVKELPDSELVSVCQEEEEAHLESMPAKPKGPIFDNIREFIKSIDPEIKKKIIDSILKIILGL